VGGAVDSPVADIENWLPVFPSGNGAGRAGAPAKCGYFRCALVMAWRGAPVKVHALGAGVHAWQPRSSVRPIGRQAAGAQALTAAVATQRAAEPTPIYQRAAGPSCMASPVLPQFQRAALGAAAAFQQFR
jgi:hypothetical protein